MGDFSDEGWLVQFEKADDEIARLDCPNKIIIFGNNIYWTYWIFIIFNFFPLENPIYELNNIVILTLRIPLLDINEGEVGHRQNQWMETTLTIINNNLK